MAKGNALGCCRALVWDQCSNQGDIYHFLRSTLCKQVAVAQVVDFDVLDVVSADQLYLAVDADRRGSAILISRQGRPDRRNVDMLNSSTRL